MAVARLRRFKADLPKPPLMADPCDDVLVSARFVAVNTGEVIFTDDGTPYIGEYSTTNWPAGTQVYGQVWISKEFRKYSSDGIRVVTRVGNKPQTYVIRYKGVNGHTGWHTLPGFFVQRPSGEWVYEHYLIPPQHPKYDPEEHKKLERSSLYDPQYLIRIEVTRIKFVRSQQPGIQGASTDGLDDFMDILEQEGDGELDVVFARPSGLKALGGGNGVPICLDLVNAARHGPALAPTRLTSRPALPSTGSANAQHFSVSEMHGTPPGGYVPSGWADSTTGFRHMQDRVLYGRQGAQRDDPGPHYYGHAARPCTKRQLLSSVTTSISLVLGTRDLLVQASQLQEGKLSLTSPDARTPTVYRPTADNSVTLTFKMRAFLARMGQVQRGKMSPRIPDARTHTV
ncbi:hypothetical protein KC318_g2142 [Hortaea werneckii]|nr:hypothetical protein KC334_g2629 [Hortaea werneckii]KAI7018758.1 hypothetical protein KC355_g3252 [Hortaea werneckii]KAI7673599.1 hypothetical protein KC318_g2142 [Hortaea werneckii]